MFSSKEDIFTKSPLALFWMRILVRNAELLQTLQFKKGHRGTNPGGQNFAFLNVSINEKPFFASEVVTFNKACCILYFFSYKFKGTFLFS